jgi:hypothetical protein
MKYNKSIVCPACGHNIELSKKTKIIRSEKYFENINCDVCFHVISVPKNEDCVDEEEKKD